jgi:uncharacterized peroxidase-related enzyme
VSAGIEAAGTVCFVQSRTILTEVIPMTRLQALDPSAAPAAARPLLQAVQDKLGRVPNLVKTFAHSPAVLRYYLAGAEALAGGALGAALREQIALATAGENECDYCASAHTLIGKGAGLAASELAANLRGESAVAKTQAALNFVRAIVEKRGRVDDGQLHAVRAAGYSDEQIVEIVANVAANIFTNYFNHVAGTQIDFPRVNAAAPAMA